MPQAILYLPPQAERWMPQMIRYCHQRGYDIIAVVSDWADIWGMLEAQPDTVVVAPLREHVPADRLPRLEVLAEQDTRVVEVPLTQRRPRLRR